MYLDPRYTTRLADLALIQFDFCGLSFRHVSWIAICNNSLDYVKSAGQNLTISFSKEQGNDYDLPMVG